MTYTIKPLAWRQFNCNVAEDGEWWEAPTVFCSFHVYRELDGSCRWRYCIDEYYDEGQHGCDSVAEGKAAAEAFYLSRLMPALEEHK